MKRTTMRLGLALGLLGAFSAIPTARADVAGSTLDALAVGARYTLSSPGLLPVGDPAQGTVMEIDAPFARTVVTQGPLINAVGSPAYPGDTVAHLGTALGTFGVPIPIPNEPVLAEANYPPTPLHGAEASFGKNGVGEAHAKTGVDGAQVTADELAQSIKGVVDVASSNVRNDVKLADNKVVSKAIATAGTTTIAGMVSIAGVTGVAEAASDGTAGAPGASLQVGRVTVAGQPAYIDGDGVHVATSPTVGEGVTNGLQSILNATFNQDGITVHAVAPVITREGGKATASSGGVLISIARVVPGLGVPGVPSLTLPGAKPIALSTPALPLRLDILLGGAQVGANATAVPVFDALGTLAPIEPPTSTGDIQSPTIEGPGASLSGALGQPVSSVGNVPNTFAVQPVSGSGPLGKGIPLGWVIVGVFAAVSLSGSFLGYARWQLLEGRRG